MKKKIVFGFLLVLLIGYSAFSQTYITQVKPIGSKLWGYANLKGEIVIEAKFKRCDQFSKEGLAPIYDPASNKSYYFIDLKGQVLPLEITGFRLMSTFMTDVPKGFSDGLVPVGLGSKWGYLNTAGKVAIPIKFDDVTEFNDGYAVARNDGKYFILDKQYGEHPVDDENIVKVKSFSEMLAPYESKNGKMGFIDEQGKIVIQAQFIAVGYFNAGLAWAKTVDKKIGYIGKNGEWVIQPQFELAKNFDPESGMARIKVNEKMGFVNKKGELLFVNDAEDIGDFTNGLCWGRKNEKTGFVNNKGEWVIPPQFEAVRHFKNGYAAVKKDDKWGLIDKEGKWVIEPSFDGIQDMELVD
jgi:hypothetical protein